MENNLTIRRAKRTDIPRFVANLGKAKSIGNCMPRKYFQWVIRDGIAIVAENGQHPAGFILAELHSKADAYVSYLYVNPRYRSKGVGTTLMRTLLRSCKRKGIRYVDLDAPKHKKKTLHFYRKLGFKPEGTYIVFYKRI